MFKPTYDKPLWPTRIFCHAQSFFKEIRLCFKTIWLTVKINSVVPFIIDVFSLFCPLCLRHFHNWLTLISIHQIIQIFKYKWLFVPFENMPETEVMKRVTSGITCQFLILWSLISLLNNSLLQPTLWSKYAGCYSERMLSSLGMGAKTEQKHFYYFTRKHIGNFCALWKESNTDLSGLL